MATTWVSSKAKVHDVEMLKKVLDSYAWPVDVNIDLREEDSGGILEVTYEDGDWDAWCSPTAVKVEDLPDPDLYPDDDHFFDAEFEVFEEKGNEGFLALLRELAQHLESPLQFLVANHSGINHAATVWLVHPGATDVETLEV